MLTRQPLGIVHWAISKSSLSPAEIRSNLAGARARQFRAWSLPTGLDMTQMEERWKSMNFGGTATEETSAFDPKYFLEVTRGIEALRQLAREGRIDSEALMEEERDLPKIVWGQPDEMGAENMGDDGSSRPGLEVEYGASELTRTNGLGDDDLPPASAVQPTDSLLMNTRSEDLADDRDAFLLDPSVVADLESAPNLESRQDTSWQGGSFQSAASCHPNHLPQTAQWNGPVATMLSVEDPAPVADAHLSSVRDPEDLTARDVASLVPSPVVGVEAELLQAVDAHLARMREESAVAPGPNHLAQDDTSDSTSGIVDTIYKN
jgi:hypothetical protein